MGISLDKFIANNTGKRLANPTTGTYQGQCVSLVQQVLAQCLGIGYRARGNAKDWVSTIPTEGIGKKVTGVPQKGDIVVWDGRQGGGYGHIGVAINSTQVFQQNDYINGHNGTSRVININWLATSYSLIRMNARYPSDIPTPPITPPTNSINFGGKYKLNTAVLNVRNSASLKGAIVAQYVKGKTSETVILDNWYAIADGYVWGRYTSYDGHVRYVAVGPNTGKVEPQKDFLVKL